MVALYPTLLNSYYLHPSLSILFLLKLGVGKTMDGVDVDGKSTGGPAVVCHVFDWERLEVRNVS